MGHLRTGGFTVIRRPALVVTASSAYSAGDNLGGLLTITDIGRTTSKNSGIIQDIMLLEAAAAPAKAAVNIIK